MKKLIPILLFCLLTGQTFSQEIKQERSREDYLAKSRNQKTVGIALVSGGVVTIIAGAVVWMNEFTRNFNLSESDWGVGSIGTGDVMMVVGGTAVLSSIPFLIAAGKNRKNAIHMSAGLQKVPQLQKTGPVYSSVPAVQLKIDL